MTYIYDPDVDQSSNDASFPLMTMAFIFFNQRGYVQKSMECALSQTYPNFELVISDDCSTDGTGDEILRFAKMYHGPHRIVVNVNERNLGMGDNFRKALSLGRGRWHVACDGDDLCRKDRLMAIYEYSKRYPEAVAIASCSTRIDGEGHEIGGDVNLSSPVIYDRYVGGLFSFSLNPGDPVSMAFATGAVAAWRRDMLDSIPFPRGIVAADVYLSLRAILYGAILFVPEKLVFQRLDGKNISQSGKKAKSRKERQRYRRRQSDIFFLSLNAICDDVEKRMLDVPPDSGYVKTAQENRARAMCRSFPLANLDDGAYKSAARLAIRRYGLLDMLKGAFHCGTLSSLLVLLFKLICAKGGRK